MTAPLRPDRAATGATRCARRLQALCRAEARAMGLRGQNARAARDALVDSAVRQIGKQLSDA